MILVIDVSNTSTTLGVFSDRELISNWRLSTISTRSSDEIGTLIRSLFKYSDAKISDIEDVIISSVVPDVMYSLTNGVRKYLKCDPVVVGTGTKTGIKLNMDNPKEMGTNRIVNLVAAKDMCDGDVIVIDYSTATTFDVLSKNGEFLTGITAPGLQICADALYKKAANLPKFEIKMPLSLITKNTIESMQAGLVISHIGEAKYIIEMLKNELDIKNAKIIATGGLARVVDDKFEIFDIYDPVLALKGLYLIYEKNKHKRKEGQKCSW